MSQSNFLTPQGAQPINDQNLMIVFGQTIVGITSFSPQLVRPRWQLNPPQQPPVSTDWVAVGITSGDRNNPVIFLNPDGLDSTLNRQQSIKLLCSFYGPNSRANAELLADGIMIPNNRFNLDAVGIKIIRVGETRAVPDIYNATWINRADITLDFTRDISRVYLIPSILSLSGTLIADNGTETTFDAATPPSSE
jgi:hypothetical protein